MNGVIRTKKIDGAILMKFFIDDTKGKGQNSTQTSTSIIFAESFLKDYTWTCSKKDKLSSLKIIIVAS